MHTVSPPHPQTPKPQIKNSTGIYWKKKSIYKWTHVTKGEMYIVQ